MRNRFFRKLRVFYLWELNWEFFKSNMRGVLGTFLDGLLEMLSGILLIVKSIWHFLWMTVLTPVRFLSLCIFQLSKDGVLEDVEDILNNTKSKK